MSFAFFCTNTNVCHIIHLLFDSFKFHFTISYTFRIDNLLNCLGDKISNLNFEFQIQLCLIHIIIQYTLKLSPFSHILYLLSSSSLAHHPFCNKIYNLLRFLQAFSFTSKLSSYIKLLFKHYLIHTNFQIIFIQNKQLNY